jgi:hypothetical protein
LERCVQPSSERNRRNSSKAEKEPRNSNKAERNPRESRRSSKNAFPKNAFGAEANRLKKELRKSKSKP